MKHVGMNVICRLFQINLSDLYPGISESGIADYQAGHTLILAHAKAYRLYERRYKRYQKGEFYLNNSDISLVVVPL